MAHYNNKNNSQWFGKLVAFLLILGIIAAFGGSLYMYTLYVTGEISPEDYARASGRVPTVILVR